MSLLREMFYFTDFHDGLLCKTRKKKIWMQRELSTKEFATQAANWGLTFNCYLFIMFLYSLLEIVNQI